MSDVLVSSLGIDAHEALAETEMRKRAFVLLDSPQGEYSPEQIAAWVLAYKDQEYAPDTPAGLMSYIRNAARRIDGKLGCLEGNRVNGGTEYVFFGRT